MLGMSGKRAFLGYERNMACSIFRVAIGGLAFFTASASAHGQRAAETITVSRIPIGLHSLDAPDYDVTLSADGQVVEHRRGYTSFYPHPEPSERVDRYQVSPAEAARFRAALVRYRPVGPGAKIICGGQVYGPDKPIFIRIPVFKVEWKGADTSSVLGVCYTEQEQAITDAIEHGLEALHVKSDGSRF